ncbi:unnamed protein product [Trifolium pratense]|uniref:Uncharacterized protein n=1 Tax=Trifolium pratense TaxID=57577 RepID=A0ACB0JW14_TRIPR|nr:unnamed protein product [Trifolium pratense]
MAKTLQFICALILFLFLFFIAKEVDGQTKCQTHRDCPKISNVNPSIPDLQPSFYKCIENMCVRILFD